MPDFVYETVVLDFPKTDLNPLQPGADPTKHLKAADWNKICQALMDVKAAITSGQYLGIGGTASEPVSESGKARLRYDTISGKVQISINGASYVSIVDSTDSRLTDSRFPTGPAGGQLGGTFPSSLTVIGVRETGGPTLLTMGAIADGKVFARSGVTVIGVNGGHEVQNAGVSLTTRSRMNFDGGLAATDGGAGPDSTIIKFGGNIVRTIYSGVGRDSNDQVTPKIVGAFSFNPADYAITNTTRSIIFRAVVAPGNGAVSAKVKLRNVTDAVDVVTLTFTGSTATAKQDSSALAVPATIPNSEKIYEIQIFTDISGGSNICTCYSAGLVVTNVVP